MAHLIDKDEAVSKIKRRIDEINEKAASYSSDSEHDYFYRIEEEAYKNSISIINSLKAKEIDLEKEINKYISDNFFGSETIGFFAVRTNEEPNDQDIALCAKHFFELGLKAQKGEQNMKNITVSMIDIENALNEVAELISVVPQECKGESKESSICRRRWIEISKRINELV